MKALIQITTESWNTTVKLNLHCLILFVLSQYNLLCNLTPFSLDQSANIYTNFIQNALGKVFGSWTKSENTSQILLLALCLKIYTWYGYSQKLFFFWTNL